MPKQPSTPRILQDLPQPSPLDNFMFAACFQSIEAAPSAISLINAVLLSSGREPLEVVDELTCEQVLLGEGRKLRGCKLDISVREGSHYLNVEAQIRSMQHMADRMAFNLNRLLSHKTPSGADYKDIPSITVISLMDFIYRKNHPDYHQPFGLFYEKDPERVYSKFDYHMVEIPKFRMHKFDPTDPLHRWLFYLDSGYMEPDSPKVKEVLEMDEGLHQFAQTYQRNVSDPDTLFAYYGYLMELADERNRIETARIEALEEGEAKGEAKGLAKAISAMNALRKGHSIADVMEISELSRAEVESLAKSLEI